MKTKYFAQAKNGNLYEFKWGEDNIFYVKIYSNVYEYIQQDPNKYQIREIEFLETSNIIKIDTK